MSGTTSRGLRYPTLTDTADVPRDVSNLATDLNGVAFSSGGLLANRPTSSPGSPGIVDRYYWATNGATDANGVTRGVLYRDNGTGWDAIADADASAATPARRTLGEFAAQAASGADRRIVSTFKAQRAPVRAVSTANVNIASPGSAFDGVTLSNSGTDRLLLVGQSTGAQNGPWVWNGAAAALTRPADYAAASTTDASTGIDIDVNEGTVFGGTKWTLTTTSAVTIDTTATTWKLSNYLGYGTLANRPAATSVIAGGTYFDSTNLRRMVSDGSAWVDEPGKSSAYKGIREAVRAVSTSNVTISAPGFTSLDGTPLTSGTSRILLVGQTTPAENGIWVFNGSGSPLTRPADFQSGSTVDAPIGVTVMVVPDVNAVESWTMRYTAGAVTIDSTSQAWQLASAPAVWTALPAAPHDGQEIYLQTLAMATAGFSPIHLRYRAASASAYKWEVVGTAPLFASVATSEATSSTSYTDLATVGPSIALPLAGDWYLEWNAKTINNTVNIINFMTPTATGLAAADANASQFQAYASSANGMMPGQMLATGISGTVKMQHRVNNASTGTFAARVLKATPIRLG